MELGFLLSLTLGEGMPGAGLVGVVVVGNRAHGTACPPGRDFRVLTTCQERLEPRPRWVSDDLSTP